MGKVLKLPSDAGRVSDGYHTFDELYTHRHALFIALMRAFPELSWRANNHHDGTGYDGFFIAGMVLPKIGDISYHLPLGYWELLDKSGITTLLNGREWDGHTSKDVINRVLEWAVKNLPEKEK